MSMNDLIRERNALADALDEAKRLIGAMVRDARKGWDHDEIVDLGLKAARRLQDMDPRDSARQREELL